jgi:hypothetical protein
LAVRPSFSSAGRATGEACGEFDERVVQRVAPEKVLAIIKELGVHVVVVGVPKYAALAASNPIP